MRATEAALAIVSAWLVTTSALAGIGLAFLMIASVAIGHMTRVGDAQSEARATARAEACRRLDDIQQAADRAVAALRAAHAADLARIAAERERLPGGQDVARVVA